ncbi:MULTISPECIES: lactonase family protein [Alistipes]|uniref:lactonase family protein n=1 Tax=Alistipes TaxID=239759 RepID=UPI001B369D25|nr:MULTISPECIES: lactonase family protein [Alistipes]MBQ4902350.1 lactonase family protein [Alistipes sp. Marseille-P2263]MCI2257625.1 lactonase family protein [Alistipes dispar]
MKAKKIIVLLCSMGMTMAVQARQDKNVPTEGLDGMFLLVGSYAASNEEAIKVYRIDEQFGNAEYVSGLAGIPNSAFLTFSADSKLVYAVSEEDGKKPAANAIRFDRQQGELTLLNTQSTEGGLPIYATLSPDGNFVLTANYMGGSITVFALDKDGRILPDSHLIPFSGKGSNEKRQKMPHLHCVKFTPDGQYLLATDLGTDHIYLVPVSKQVKKGEPKSLLDEAGRIDIQMEAGSGPRHICFHPNGRFVYLISELSGKITVFSYQGGKLERLQTIVCDPFVIDGSADIHVSSDGKFLYASKRLKEDGIVIYSIEPEKGTLKQIGYQPTDLYPRNFALSPNNRYLLVVCRDGGRIQIFERNQDTGLLKDTGKNIKIDRPAFVMFL